ncbi:hypothetical protein Hanom_Chr12g01086211 [Helianthus anomalus]
MNAPKTPKHNITNNETNLIPLIKYLLRFKGENPHFDSTTTTTKASDQFT